MPVRPYSDPEHADREMVRAAKLKIRWFNSSDCELAQVTAFNERDAARQLVLMVADGGNELKAGDYFRVELKS